MIIPFRKLTSVVGVDYSTSEENNDIALLHSNEIKKNDKERIY
jgi:hypothetical protein